MRLVCPNCEAKYEVPDDAIPDTGRDVQCASCGHAWFQMRGRAAETAAAPEPVEAAPSAEPEPEPDAADAGVAGTEASAPEVTEPEEPEEVVAAGPPATDGMAEPEPAEATGAEEPVAEEPASVAAAEDAAEAGGVAPSDPPAAEAAAEEEDEEDAAPVAVAAPVPYAVDDSVLAILREEAEREANARRAESRPLETQPELGIDAAVAAAAVIPPPMPAEDHRPSARRDLLPDVEEINSTLRPSDHPAEPDLPEAGMPPPVPDRQGGFRSGFLMVMTVAIIGAGLYIAAPTLSRLVPALDAPLDSYTAMIDGLRLHLDGVMRQATVALNGG